MGKAEENALLFKVQHHWCAAVDACGDTAERMRAVDAWRWGSSSGCCPALKGWGMAQAMPHWGNDEHDLPAASSGQRKAGEVSLGAKKKSDPTRELEKEILGLK